MHAVTDSFRSQSYCLMQMLELPLYRSQHICNRGEFRRTPTFTASRALLPSILGIRSTSALISDPVGALLWDSGCSARAADSALFRALGRGSCGCEQWKSVIWSSSDGLQKTSVPAHGINLQYEYRNSADMTLQTSRQGMILADAKADLPGGGP